MRRIFLTLVLVASVSLTAQEAAIPVLEAAELQTVAVVLKMAAKANAACQALDDYKLYVEMRNAVHAQLAAKYPGFTVNWATRKLEPAVSTKGPS
jgi:hypothetical protein